MSKNEPDLSITAQGPILFGLSAGEYSMIRKHSLIRLMKDTGAVLTDVATIPYRGARFLRTALKQGDEEHKLPALVQNMVFAGYWTLPLMGAGIGRFSAFFLTSDKPAAAIAGALTCALLTDIAVNAYLMGAPYNEPVLPNRRRPFRRYLREVERDFILNHLPR